MHPRTASLAAVLLLAGPAAGSDLQAGNRVDVPGMGLATDDGSTSVPVNPALIGFDSDPALSILYHTGLLDPSVALQANATAGGLGLGVYYAGNADLGAFWGLSTTLAFRLTDTWTVGSTLEWNIPEGADNNFTSWDLGMGWRPLYWLGFGASARNIGNPAPRFGAIGNYGVGIALRPFGDALSVGFDHLFQDPYSSVPTDDGPTQVNRLILRSAPIKGLVLRLSATDEISVGGGVELYFGKTGVGAYDSVTGSDFDTQALTAGVLSTRPAEHLIGGGRRVPEYRIQDAYPYTPRATLFSRAPEGYLHLLKRLQATLTDPTVKGVLIDLDASPFSFAQVEEIRGLIGDIRASKRPVVVFLGADEGNAAYYLATAATRVYIHPAASLDLTGVSAEMQYFRSTLDTLGVGVQFASRSEYKSAIEPFTRTSPSQSSQEQMNALLDDLESNLVLAISIGRAKSQAEVQALIDGGPWTAREAMEHGLVDGVVYPDQLDKELQDLFPKGFERDDTYGMDEGVSGWTRPKRIAVIPVAGTITSGPSAGPGLFGGAETAGSETIVKALEQAGKDHTVKAVVLRVDSPGGSAFASDEIWRAVEQVRKDKKKPVIVSMGGYAASGGYYVSAAGDAIFAEPSTVTGSIGVFGGKVNFEGLFDKVGIDTAEFTRGRKANMWSPSRPFDATELATLDHLIGETYDQFKSRVADGRKLEAEEVEKLARGRVWSGDRGTRNRLVDQSGGFYDAVARAKEMAKLKKNSRVDLVTYGPNEDALGHLPVELIRSAIHPAGLPASVRLLQRWQALDDEHLWMMTPYELEIH
jgi:protease IV